jgi:hypothetical protein
MKQKKFIGGIDENSNLFEEGVDEALKAKYSEELAFPKCDKNGHIYLPNKPTIVKMYKLENDKLVREALLTRFRGKLKNNRKIKS